MNTDGHGKEHIAQGGGTGQASAGKGQALGVLPASTDVIPFLFSPWLQKEMGVGGPSIIPPQRCSQTCSSTPKCRGLGGGNPAAPTVQQK